MLDPFPIPRIPGLSHLAQRISPYFALNVLHLHIHEVLLAALFYQFVSRVVSPAISSRLAPKTYPHLPWQTKLDWDVHVTSLVQGVIICVVSFWVMENDEERAEMDFRGRIWGYTGASAMVQSFSAGYFVWDLYISSVYVDLFGVGLLAHAISASTVYMFGFRPFLNWYAPVFALYELSAPCLNFHWFFDTLDMSGSAAQWINGILFMATFFGCRLVYGIYMSVQVFSDVWEATQYQDTAAGRAWIDNQALVARSASGEAASEVWRHTYGATMPLWLGALYLVCNTTLNCLNVYWFGKMIATVREQFEPPFGTRKIEENTSKVAAGQGMNDGTCKTSEINLKDARRRVVEAKSLDLPPPN